jgi:endonuclease-3
MEEGRGKRPFDIDEAMTRIGEAVKPYPKAAMFELAERGHDTPFEQLIACLISVRTYDEVSLPAALGLFKVARTPAAIAALSPAEIDAHIQTATFHDRKAVQIRDIARRVVDEYKGALPCDAGVMQSFAGIGPKCANLALGVACNAPVISVDVHVHRISNRWGYVVSRSPEHTMDALAEVLPRRYRVEINKLLVPFGKHICTGVRPKCSICPVLEMCQQVGVTSHR